MNFKYYLKQEQEYFIRYIKQEATAECFISDKPRTVSISNDLKNDPSSEFIGEVILKINIVRSAGGRSSAGAPAVFYQPEPELLCFLPSSGWKIRMTYITSVILLQENMQYYRTYSRHSLL